MLRHLWVTDDENIGARARANRERAIENVVSIFRGGGAAGDTTGNSPGTKWTAFNAIAELDCGRRYIVHQPGAAFVRRRRGKAAGA